MEKLNPCLCGCTRILISEDTIARHAYAYCSQCHLTGPDMADRMVAIREWNNMVSTDAIMEKSDS